MANIHKAFKVYALDGNIGEMEKALAQGADINYVENGETALISAARLNQHKVVKFLIDNGAKLDVIGSGQGRPRSALVHAVFNKSAKMIELLLEGGARVDLQDLEGETALSMACEIGSLQAVKLLFKHRAQVNLQDRNGRSALMLASASKFGRKFVLTSTLLKHGAAIDLLDKDGKTALIHAIENQEFDISKLLLKRGAKFNLGENPALFYSGKAALNSRSCC